MSSKERSAALGKLAEDTALRLKKQNNLRLPSEEEAHEIRVYDLRAWEAAVVGARECAVQTVCDARVRLCCTLLVVMSASFRILMLRNLQQLLQEELRQQ